MRRKNKNAPKSNKSSKSSIQQKQSNDYALIAANFHESSHTIAALANLIYVSSVNVNPAHQNGEDVGTTSYEAWEEYLDPQLTKLTILAELQLLYAGLVGEKIYYKDITGSSKFPMHLKVGSWNDIASASSLIRKSEIATPGTETQILKRKIQQEVEKFLIEHWMEVKLISHQLYKKKTLVFDDLKTLLTRKNPHKDFWIEKFKKIKLLRDSEEKISEETIKTLLSPKI